MDVIKDLQGQSNKIYSKIVHVENGKITKKFDINYRIKITKKKQDYNTAAVILRYIDKANADETRKKIMDDL